MSSFVSCPAKGNNRIYSCVVQHCTSERESLTDILEKLSSHSVGEVTLTMKVIFFVMPANLIFNFKPAALKNLETKDWLPVSAWGS